MANPLSSNEPLSDYVRVNGLRLHYLDWGGDGPPIVIVHATGFLGRAYRPIALALRSIGHVYSYDQRGHGDSECPTVEEINWYRMADDLEGFLNAMGFRAVRSWGHSAGGTAIAAIADLRPELIARAMLVEPVIVDQNNPRQNWLYDRTIKRKANFESLEAMYANFVGKLPYNTWHPDVLRDYCEYGSRPDADGRRWLKCTPAVEAKMYQSARDFNGLSHILASTVPTLVVFGEQSESPGGIEFAERIAHDAPQRRVMSLPDGGHLVPMEQPDKIAQIAIEFFADGNA
jgi:pimeloyl-ACP methyl ester carboxylesterase